MKPAANVPHAAWQRALTELTTATEDPSAMTTVELARVWGCSQRTAWTRVNRLIDAGMAHVVRKTLTDRTGRLLVRAAYVLWTKPKAGKGRL